MPKKSKTTIEDRVRTRIRALREENRLTQEELCERAGISVDAVSRIEGGSRIPTLPTLEKLANALGGTLTDLIGDSAPIRSEQPAAVRRAAMLLEGQSTQIQKTAEAIIRALIKSSKQNSQSK